jgi:hypothetical protein
MSVRDESWHRAAGQSGALRAAVFGINDGLVSNLALVMGFAGAATENQIIVLAGVAGLLAGAFSMAAGEYVSMHSQKELFERQIDLEREELRFRPEERTSSRRCIIRDSLTMRQMVASRLMQTEHALDTKIARSRYRPGRRVAWGAAPDSSPSEGAFGHARRSQTSGWQPPSPP